MSRIACLADKTEKAQAAYKTLAAHHHFIDIAGKRTKPDVIVALGGDGFMLQVLHRYMHRNIPVYGMNCGTVGFLMNRFHDDDLAERIARARKSTLHPLMMYARTADG